MAAGLISSHKVGAARQQKNAAELPFVMRIQEEERLTFAIKGGQSLQTVESFAYPVGKPCAANVCVQGCVCTAGGVSDCFFIFIFLKSDLLEEKAEKK